MQHIGSEQDLHESLEAIEKRGVNTRLLMVYHDDAPADQQYCWWDVDPELEETK